MIACRRYSVKLSKKDHEKDVLKILGNSRLEVKTKICAVTAKNDWTVLHKLETIFQRLINEKAIMQVIQGARAITIIADEKLKNEVVNAVGKENVLRVRPSLVEISVKSPEDHGDQRSVLIPGVQPVREQRQRGGIGLLLHRHHLHRRREGHDPRL